MMKVKKTLMIYLVNNVDGETKVKTLKKTRTKMKEYGNECLFNLKV
jgi:hypothetical protein